jgi:hypothetical protein
VSIIFELLCFGWLFPMVIATFPVASPFQDTEALWQPLSISRPCFDEFAAATDWPTQDDFPVVICSSSDLPTMTSESKTENRVDPNSLPDRT